jgi:hypothetical protein
MVLCVQLFGVDRVGSLFDVSMRDRSPNRTPRDPVLRTGLGIGFDGLGRGKVSHSRNTQQSYEEMPVDHSIGPPGAYLVNSQPRCGRTFALICQSYGESARGLAEPLLLVRHRHRCEGTLEG